jgi:hypothetical protein
LFKLGKFLTFNFFIGNLVSWPDVVVHTYNPSIWATEAGRSQVQGQPGLHSETLSEKKEKKVSLFTKLHDYPL